MQAEVKALFDAYRDAFVEAPAAAAAFYSEPCVTARLGTVRVHPSHADIAALFAEVDMQYRNLGYTHTDYVSFNWLSLGTNSALITMLWAYKDHDARTIWETTFSYNLYKRKGAWKILVQTMHDP
jgi:hypothetical protein